MNSVSTSVTLDERLAHWLSSCPAPSQVVAQALRRYDDVYCGQIERLEPVAPDRTPAVVRVRLDGDALDVLHACPKGLRSQLAERLILTWRSELSSAMRGLTELELEVARKVARLLSAPLTLSAWPRERVAMLIAALAPEAGASAMAMAMGRVVELILAGGQA